MKSTELPVVANNIRQLDRDVLKDFVDCEVSAPSCLRKSRGPIEMLPTGALMEGSVLYSLCCELGWFPKVTLYVWVNKTFVYLLAQGLESFFSNQLQ